MSVHITKYIVDILCSTSLLFTHLRHLVTELNELFYVSLTKVHKRAIDLQECIINSKLIFLSISLFHPNMFVVLVFIK